MSKLAIEMRCPKCGQKVKSHDSWDMNSKLANVRTFLFKCWNCRHKWRVVRKVKKQKSEVWH